MRHAERVAQHARDLDPATGDLPAAKVPYDNTTSGLGAVNLQQAVDELAGAGPGAVDAADVAYDNGASGLIADDVQAAIDEVVTLIPSPPPVHEHMWGDPFAGDGTTTEFTLSLNPISQVAVYVDGLRVGGYSMDASVITFDVPPALDAEILVDYDYAP